MVGGWTVGIGWVLAAGAFGAAAGVGVGARVVAADACHGVDDDDGVLRRADRVRIHLVRERRRLA